MAQEQINIPKNLLVYKPKQHTTALCWQPDLTIPVALNLLEFEVEIDVVVDFSSINKKTYTKENVLNYQNGTFFKSFVIEDPLLFETQKYYWRVRVNCADYISEWSDYQEQNTIIFLDNLEYNLPTRVKSPTINASKFVIQKTYITQYTINGIVYNEQDFIDELNDTYSITLFLGDLQYDVDKKIQVGESEYITVRMIHLPLFALGTTPEARYTKEDFISLLETDYGITDSIYEYVGPYEFDVNSITWYEDTETAENLLPDNYVYTKSGNTNIKRIIEMYMRLIGVFKDETIQVANNYNYRKTQDEDLYDMLGVLLTYTRNNEEPFITYKYELLNLWQAYLHQGTIDAFNIIFQTFYGVTPQIQILKNVVDETWFLYGQMQLLSIDGATPANLNINKGDAFYNADIDKIVIATEGNTVGNWNNVYEKAPNETTTYQVSTEPQPSSKGLYFVALEDNSTIGYTITGTLSSLNIKYSYDETNWTSWDGTIITLNKNQILYVKGNNSNGLSQSSTDYFSFVMTNGKIAAYGNINSLLDDDKGNTINTIPNNYCFIGLFKNCSSLISMPSLPATTLKDFCYAGMFNNCTSLVNVTILPATTVKGNCYEGMFSGCSSLTVAPALPATTLDYACYMNMFNNCTSLQKAPNLPATTLVSECYMLMFYNCTSLKEIRLAYTGNFADVQFAFNSWVYRVSNNGTIYYSGTDTSNFGDSAIPTGWSIQPYIEDNNSYINYTYNSEDKSFQEGTPNVERYYLNIGITSYIGDVYTPSPFLYTNQYLAHNLLITINNIYGIQLDKKILMEILNNLKPLNVNIILNINNI